MIIEPDDPGLHPIRQRVFCDADGPHEGMYRYSAYIYVTAAEQEAMDKAGEFFPGLTDAKDPLARMQAEDPDLYAYLLANARDHDSEAYLVLRLALKDYMRGHPAPEF